MPFFELRAVTRKPGDILPPGVLEDAGGYYTLHTKAGDILRLRKRTAYPETYAYQTSEGTLVCGYGSCDPRPTGEFLQIIMDRQGRVVVKRDAYATLPLFYGHTQNILVISNSYECVLKILPVTTLNEKGLLQSLLPSTADRDTLWNEVAVLGERQTLEWSGGCLRLVEPVGRGWSSSPRAPEVDPASFKKTLDAHFDDLLQNVFLRNDFAFEVSGGLDSATLPLYAAPFLKYRDVSLFSIEYPGDFATSQREKLETLSTATNMQLFTVAADPRFLYPLSRMIQTGRFSAHHCSEEIYSEAIEGMVAKMASLGVSVVATGLGGDDILENRLSAEVQLAYGDCERRRRASMRYPTFYTPAFRAAYIESVPDIPQYPLPLLPLSLSGRPNTHNNIYIEHDIWPVSVYADPRLYKFCQGLPAHFRANKNILRAYHSAYGFPEAIYNPGQNEHFGPFFEMSLSSGEYDSIINWLADYSQTAALGFADVQLLLATYSACKVDPAADRVQLYYVFQWISTEINLQLAAGRLGWGFF